MSISKFARANNQDNGSLPNGAVLHWRRAVLDSAPFRGSPNALFRDEEIEKLANREYDAKVDTFKLWDPEDRARYVDIIDKTANNWYQVLFVERHYVPEEKNMIVYLEWVEPYLAMPHESQYSM